MKLPFGFELKRMGASKVRVRNYQGAKSDNFTADWMTTNLVADDILRWQLPKLRARSRDLAANNDHMKNFLRKLKVNVVGHKGITLQNKARLRNGDLDKSANRRIEEAFRRWSKTQNCSVCGELSLRDILNLAIESVGRDGETLIRMVRGYDNPFRFALQVLESDHLDENLNTDLPNGNKIRLGVEKNPWGKPVAYHLFTVHPGESMAAGQKRVRVPAEEIIHVYLKERASQSRGVPWAHTAIIRLRMLGAAGEAAVIALRIGASKMGFIIEPEEGEYEGDAKDEQGNAISEVEPGLLERLRHGSEFKEFNPNWPNGEYAPFEKAMLRGVSSGLGCSYNSLANDLEGVNFSSLRSGLLDERDGWKVIQEWFIEHTIDRIFPVWLEMAILSGQLPYSITDLGRLNAPQWQPRRWPWVDPLKDVNAQVTALGSGLTTRTRICAEQGEDFEDIVEQLREEQALLKEAGITLSETKPQQGASSDTTGDPQEGGNNDNGN